MDMASLFELTTGADDDSCLKKGEKLKKVEANPALLIYVLSLMILCVTTYNACI